MVTFSTSYLNVPYISFKEVGIPKTTNIFIFPPLRPGTPAPRPQHGFQLIVGGGWDTEEGMDFEQRAFSGGDAGTAATMQNVTKGSTFVAGTKNVDYFKMTVNSKPDEIYVIAVTQTAADVGGMTAKKKEILTHALAGTTPDAADGLIFSKNGATPAAISTALQLYFGADPDAAFDLAETFVADDTLLFTAGDVGENGNFQEYGSQILPGDPNLEVLFGNSFEPYVTGLGKGRSAGIIANYNPNAAPTILKVPGDNTPFDAGQAVVGLDDSGSFDFKQRDNPELVGFLTNSDLSYGPQNTNLYAGKQGLTRLGLIIVTPSSKTRGQLNFKVVYEAIITSGFNQNFAKAADPIIKVTYAAIAADSADSTGFDAFFREFATA